VRGHLVNLVINEFEEAGTVPDVQHFDRHRATELPAVLGFLVDLALNAHNWRGEQAIRPAERHPQDVRRRQSLTTARGNAAGFGQHPSNRALTIARRRRHRHDAVAGTRTHRRAAAYPASASVN
jgi:hypothetical protein